MIEMETAHSATQKQRRWHSKVRTGCEQCKQRRIKCDEHHPACLHCERAGKTCEYAALKFKIFELSTGPGFDSSLEKQSYAYFAAEGARLVSTYQHSVGPFWQKIALQIGHEYHAVRHGITAMGAIQEPLHYSNPGQIVTSRQPEMNSLSLQNMAKSMHMASLASPETFRFGQ
jgi:Fungal Zn(2)-Cys(6) binuclear cluster domain